ncbi:CDP-alcohol phosphatidyltransferase family protein [Clostridium ljungdahlii]|uniref:Phosphatidylglycerophosphate synthase n=1 Tax=Clostridium ljungdahlii TaxID=1538 RepID=A0A168QLS7_9CLOT|nr:CDP-alcohol phosphatidyltransferase family protein [Clostridium ljungdahlii]OAA89318.1 CDP-alcohol phosphatidyltransferase [Clostridium ljungdahlii]
MIINSVANCISLLRVFLEIMMLFVKPLSGPFFIIFLACQITDVLDGYIARKTHTVSKLGDNLDSIGDFIMILVLIIVLYPVIKLTIRIIIWVFIIAMIKIISMIIIFIKYKTFEMLHTYGNKFTGVILFAFIISLAFVQSNMIMYIVCTIASISAIEELLINLFSSELQINRKSLFIK